MKIEICESLILSWLRHAQGCVVAQLNWKPSPTWTVAKERELAEAFAAIRHFASQEIGIQIFKNGEFSQFIRQAEIDVLGIRGIDASPSPSVIAVDSAFHENGLQYGNADETVGRVLKKLIRAACALEAYLEVGDASVLFATPKMPEPIRQAIQEYLAKLEACLAAQAGLAIDRLHFRIIANADFTDQILKPVLEQLQTVADTSELFVRAQQLMRFSDSSPRNRPSQGRSNGQAEAAIEGSRIGEHVRATMEMLAASGRLPARIVGDLLDPRYCKARFNLGYPFLKRVDHGVPLSRQGNDRHGRGRYWKKPLRVGNHEFLMCNNWYVWQRGAFDSWVRDVE